MSRELLVHASDVAAAQAELATFEGRVVHILTPNLIVISLPDGVEENVLSTMSPPANEQLDAQGGLLADLWLSRFGRVSRSSERLTRAATAQPLSWDTPGRTPPDHLPGRPSVVARDRAAGDVTRSTDTPTSLVLTDSVAVGVVMVSGPPGPPAWTSVHGALKYVSVAADGSVWGVNEDDEIYSWNGTSWTQLPGALKQISVGDANTIWGVNEDDEIYQFTGSGWTQLSG